MEKKYFNYSSNVMFGFNESVERHIEEGYLPIGRMFQMHNIYYQTMLHKSSLKNVGKQSQNQSGNEKKYMQLKSRNEYKLADLVNLEIEKGYLPAGRMALIDEEYVQTMIHESFISNMTDFTANSMLEGSNKAL